MIHRILIALLLVGLGAGVAGAKEVVATGEADGTDLAAKDRALEDAMRKALEQAFGTFIKSESETKDFTLVRDRIFAEVKGIVKKYQILSVTKDGGTTKVTIRADVAEANFKNRWSEIRTTLDRKKYPRTMFLLYELDVKTLRPLKDGEAGFRTFSAQAVTSRLEEYFLKKKFHLVDRDRFFQVKGAELQISQLQANTARLIALTRDFGCELILFGHIRGTPGRAVKIPGTEFTALQYNVEITAKGIRADTSKIVVSMSRKYLGSGVDHASARSNALKKAAEEYGKELLKKIIKSWSTDLNVASTVQIEVQNVSFTEVAKLEETLRKQRWMGQIKPRSYSSKVQVWDVDTRLSTRDLAMKLATLESGVSLEITAVQQNRIIAKVKGN